MEEIVVPHGPELVDVLGLPGNSPALVVCQTDAPLWVMNVPSPLSGCPMSARSLLRQYTDRMNTPLPIIQAGPELRSHWSGQFGSSGHLSLSTLSPGEVPSMYWGPP